MRTTSGSVLLALAATVGMPAGAQEVIRLAAEDTWIDGLNSGAPHGMDTTLGICPVAMYWIYLKFDVSGLEGEVVAAELRFNRVSGERPDEISAYRLANDAWSEATLTGVSRPQPDPLDEEALTVGEEVAGYDRWTSEAFLDAVRAEANGDGVLSLVLRENAHPMIDIRFYRSRDAAVQDANKPRLVLSLAPFEVQGLVLAHSGVTTLGWISLGAGVTYDVMAGDLSTLRVVGGVDDAQCLAGGVAGSMVSDPNPDPPAGAGYYYLVRGRNECCAGTYGYATSGAERTPLADCP